MNVQKFPVKEAGPLDAFIATVLAGARPKRVQQLLKFKAVAVNGEVVSKGKHALAVGDVVTISFEGRPVQNAKLAGGLELVYEDADLIVINKPPGLLTIATETERERTAYALLTEYVRERGREERVFIVHRLDKGTSGLLVFARSEAVKRMLQDGWGQVEKKYLAIVEGRPKEESGTIRSFLRDNKGLNVYSTNEADGVPAVTHYRIVSSSTRYSLLEITLETGRKNQIRVHLSDQGHPVLGDMKYGAHASPAGRLALHASVLSFKHPVRHDMLTFTSPLPEKLRGLMKG